MQQPEKTSNRCQGHALSQFSTRNSKCRAKRLSPPRLAMAPNSKHLRCQRQRNLTPRHLQCAGLLGGLLQLVPAGPAPSAASRCLAAIQHTKYPCSAQRSRDRPPSPTSTAPIVSVALTTQASAALQHPNVLQPYIPQPVVFCKQMHDVRFSRNLCDRDSESKGITQILFCFLLQ